MANRVNRIALCWFTFAIFVELLALSPAYTSINYDDYIHIVLWNFVSCTTWFISIITIILIRITIIKWAKKTMRDNPSIQIAIQQEIQQERQQELINVEQPQNQRDHLQNLQEMQDQQGEPHEEPQDQQDQQDQQGEHQEEDSDCCVLFKVFIILMYIIWIRPLIIYVLYLGVSDSNIFAIAIWGNFTFVIISIIVISLYENCMKLCAKCCCCKKLVYKMIFICANVED